MYTIFTAALKMHPPRQAEFAEFAASTLKLHFVLALSKYMKEDSCDTALQQSTMGSVAWFEVINIFTCALHFITCKCIFLSWYCWAEGKRMMQNRKRIKKESNGEKKKKKCVRVYVECGQPQCMLSHNYSSAFKHAVVLSTIKTSILNPVWGHCMLKKKKWCHMG